MLVKAAPYNPWRELTVLEKIPAPLIFPNPLDPRLTETVAGIDQTGARIETTVPVERPLSLYLNAQEIVNMLTINDYPEFLALVGRRGRGGRGRGGGGAGGGGRDGRQV